MLLAFSLQYTVAFTNATLSATPTTSLVLPGDDLAFYVTVSGAYLCCLPLSMLTSSSIAHNVQPHNGSY